MRDQGGLLTHTMNTTDDIDLDTVLAYRFRHYRYNYKASEGFPAAVNKPSGRAVLDIEKGRPMLLVDPNCESDFVAFQAEFIKTQFRPFAPVGWPSTWLLCRATEKVPGTCNKGDYFLVQPKARLQGSGDTGGAEIVLEFRAMHRLGKNPDAKVVVQREETI